MGAGAGRLGRWTRYFTVASALWLVAAAVAPLAGADRRATAVVALFGFVCPMIFGMAYLLLPSYVGRTLADQRLPGAHFALAFGGAALLSTAELARTGAPLADLPAPPTAAWGAALWGAGVLVFVGALAWTILPAAPDRLRAVVSGTDRPQRSTRVATAAIPVAISYLALGSAALLGRAGLAPAVLPTALPRIVHLVAAGFGALLVFALGARLLVGFFHVAPPRPVTWLTIGAGAAAPAVLAANLWVAPGFQAGAALQATAMVGYAGMVGAVVASTDRRRVGLHGIALGALAGLAAVAVGAFVAFHGAAAGHLDAHAALVLRGFFPLTVAGYAYHFFAVTDGSFPGASDRAALATFGALAVGAALAAAGRLLGAGVVATAGDVVALAGAGAYAYAVARRLLGE